MTHRRALLLLLVALALAPAAPLAAQRLGIDVGYSGVENSDPVNRVAGATLSVPLGGFGSVDRRMLQRVSVSAFIVRWEHADANQAYLGTPPLDPPYSRSGAAWGQFGFGATAMVRVAGDGSGASLHAGGGVAWQERITYDDGATSPYFHARPSLALEATFPQGRFVPYVRVDAFYPGVHGRAGASVRLF